MQLQPKPMLFLLLPLLCKASHAFDSTSGHASHAPRNWPLRGRPSNITSSVSAYHFTRSHAVTNDTFLAFFDFFTAPDPTHGFVQFVGQDDALQSEMLRLDDGQILMAADRQNDTVSGRRSIRVHSRDTFDSGMFVIDLEHVPAGCGTWPAFWTCGPNWPSGGEIDILEGVHRQSHDQSTLHTSEGCDQSSLDPASFTGNWGKQKDGQHDATDCYVHASNQWDNAGCGISDDDSASFGTPFNSHKGGIFATLWDPAQGIRMWNWPRGAAPPDIVNRTEPQPDSWGTPYARFDFGDNCASSHFHDHQIIFDLTFCGDWAGSTFQQACPDLHQTCEAYVGRAENVQDSYWLVNYVDIWDIN